MTTNKNTEINIALTATDPDGDNLTYYIVTQPSHGTLSGTPPNLTYTPTSGYTGQDSFTFKANDGIGDSNIATVSITVVATITYPESWVSVGPEGGSIYAIVIDPNNSNVIYAGTSAGVFKSTNGRSTWSAINSGITYLYIKALAIDHNNSNILYAGTNVAGVFKSTNGGTNWSASNSGLPTPLQVRALAIDPYNTNVIYSGGIITGGVYKSTNGGASWYAINSGLTNIFVHTIIINPINSNIIYAGTEGGFFKSTNGGGTWTWSAIVPGLPGIEAMAIAIDRNNTNVLYVGTWRGVFKSIDGGTTWGEINSGLTNLHINALIIDSYDSNTIYAGTYGGGVFRSVDGGITWSAINSGLTNLNINFNAMAIDPNNSSIVYAGAGGGVFKTQGSFNDVPVGYWAYNYIMGIYNAQITQGCSANPLQYCPGNPVTREQMAAFIVRAVFGEPPTNYCGGVDPFTDVPAGSWSCKYIKKLLELNITQGCGGGNYCPTDNVTREQMAAFLVRAKEGDPPLDYCDTGSPFEDVPHSSIFCKYVKKLLELNITQGCGAGMYCPSDDVLRDQMAAFLARAFLGMP
ncbi:MAG: hypothetical protein A2V86_08710 [Deltaproteobacteria bacterium RBG_16_49_23]|nr:MAG: hypothetical protein A2V86_08710 [Deltaproteobacteria bacterium RBG_16_49_23]